MWKSNDTNISCSTTLQEMQKGHVQTGGLPEEELGVEWVNTELKMSNYNE